jgi:thiol-disulfide isomerase/thioredoxin/YHS domain-containing protein
MSRARLLAAACLLCACTFIAHAADPTPAAVWKTNFAEAQEEARRANLPLVVHFHAPWCGPCRKMDRELLNSQELMKLLEGSFIAVKVNVEKDPSTQQKFRVESLPTDLIVAPDGKVLFRSETYGPGDRQRYLAKINQVRSGQAASGRQPVAAARRGPQEKLVPEPIEPHEVALDDEGAQPVIRPAPIDGNAEENAVITSQQLALDGFCPVTLRNTRAWKAGDEQIPWEHEGFVYRFASVEARSEFKKNPSRFAPRLLGCDPVVLAETDLAVRGSTRFGAFYDGGLYLFQSAQSRAKFRKSPDKFSRLQHALKPDDVKRLADAGN